MSEPDYQPLSPETPAWGEVAVLSWDSEVFGFPVATYRASDASAISRNLPAVREALQSWAAGNDVEVIGCSIAATEPRWRFCLPQLGFRYVDSTLIYSLPKLQRTKFPRRYQLRPATLADQESVERIAEQSFEAGRYHADPLFPRALAQRRFRKWLTQAFESLSLTSRVFVLGEPGAATAFSHSYVHGDEAHITIGGVDAAFHRRGLGPAIFVGTFAALQELGVRRAHSKVSVGNPGAMNCAAFGGARFSDPQHVYHWHAPNAPHLLDATALAN